MIGVASETTHPVDRESDNWDQWATHRELLRLLVLRGRFRFARTMDRIRSPRRIVATTLTLLFLVLYIANGWWILSTRQPADPERMRWWLSGGMVMYGVYHALRCAWSRQTAELEMSPAEILWLGGAPIRRSSLAIYHVAGLVFSTALKTALLAVVLAVDAKHLELMCIGVFTSLLLMEIVRLTVGRWASSLSETGRRKFRVVTTLIATAIALQVILRTVAMTPMGAPTVTYVIHLFSAIGQTAASDAVQWMSLPWIPTAHLAVAETYGMWTMVQFASAIAILPLAILTLVGIDSRSRTAAHQAELAHLQRNDYRSSDQDLSADPNHRPSFVGISNWLSRWGWADAAAVMSRQWISVRRYSGTIVFSFVVPTVLCLSPLATGRITDQWFFVVGGIALCTVLLAPPALRIDFRRDLKRMQLLRSLPVRPIAMVIGQLAIPVFITCLFQWITIAIAAAVTMPGWSAVMLWTGMLSALSLFTFAIENALFLAFPHHEKAEGIAMMIRAKLTFLGKAALMIASLAILAGWATWCQSNLPQPAAAIAMVTGAVAATWGIAGVAVWVTAGCWRRFDLSLDVPPQ
ncbi:hypothetical protein K227x_25430 [Rubripirellula lacrimiformis]|uniref:Uncharacterized protein n=1 Tax=Rubripirellula lacrimiformis TaxID=1930273 RepID=A0A517NAJ4_9BACT|nr:hypothetical protein [Rubripirellula lacrimiformis]QDT04154.1 hypothetical protein K227x_25430 [Rubripirellula lacrimiformis]